ncbi:hypothetical protein [Spirosoma areae]
MYVSRKGGRWTKDCLGSYANSRGVYIHHSDNEILYIGQTVKGKWGTFSERLRREFQETSSQASGLYRMLEEQTHQIRTVCFDLDEIDQLISFSTNDLSKENKALIFEQLLIGIFQPQGNKSGIFKKIGVEAKATAMFTL